jgi:hypothetical protein
MAAEYDFQINAQHHQAELLAEATARRLLRTSAPRPQDPIPGGRRLQTLLRRLAGSPGFA